MDRPPPLFTADISLFLDALQGVHFIISYQPLSDEQPPMRLAKIRNFCSGRINFELPSDKNIDPIVCAEEIIKQYSSQTAAIFIPGQRFDQYGTRHGRGGGWYDRFLSRVPSTWIRAGVTDLAHFSNQPLIRQSWDEPMDWIVLLEEKTTSLIRTNTRT